MCVFDIYLFIYSGWEAEFSARTFWRRTREGDRRVVSLCGVVWIFFCVVWGWGGAGAGGLRDQGKEKGVDSELGRER